MTSNDLKTVLKNVSGGTLYIPFLPPHGRNLADDGTYSWVGGIDALMADTDRGSRTRMGAVIDAMIVAGKITITPPVPQVVDANTGNLLAITSTGGSLGIRQATQEADRVPAAPTSAAEDSKTATTVTISWLAPVDFGSSPVTEYVVEYKANASPTWLSVETNDLDLSFQVTGLITATAYNFRVKAKSLAGTGAASNQVNVTTS